MWLREKQQEAASLAEVATNAIVPSRRDFTQFIASQRRDLAVVPRLKRRDPTTGGHWPSVDLKALGLSLDDTEVAAFAVATAAWHGASIADLEMMRAILDAPLLRDDLCIDERLIYDSRLRGADAVRIPVADLSIDDVDRLCAIAVSLHMTPVLEIGSPAEVQRSPLRPPHCVGLSCTAADGFVDLDCVRVLAAAIPHHVVAVLLAEPRDIGEILSLRGHVDAVVAGDVLLDAERPDERVHAILNA